MRGKPAVRNERDISNFAFIERAHAFRIRGTGNGRALASAFRLRQHKATKYNPGFVWQQLANGMPGPVSVIIYF